MTDQYKGLSFTVSCILTLVLIGIVVFDPPRHLISWDVFGYYLYLPQTIIHGDPGMTDFSLVQQTLDMYHPSTAFYQAALSPEGHWVIMYTMGMAIIYFPFFIIGHIAAWLLNFPMDGFSLPYEISMIAGSCFYTIAGVFLLRKVCLLFFNEVISAILIVLIGFGTNYFFLTTKMVGMSHIYMFTLFCLVILLTDKWYKKQRPATALLLGMVFGVLVLSRPTELLAGIVILFWPNNEINSFSDRVRFFFVKNLKSTITFLAVLILCFFPQFLYWKIFGGNWFYQSYTNAGEGFEFLSPYTWEFLFSFRKGWFIYTPVMLFAIAGVFIIWKRKNEFFLPVFLFLVINIYVLSSWSNWWYAGSFGQRPVIDSYPLMSIPLGYFLIWLSGKKRSLRSIFIPAFSFLIFLNLFQTWQMNNWIMSEYRMTWPYYKAIFLSAEKPGNADDLLLIDRMKAVAHEVLDDTTDYSGRDIYYDSFERISENPGGYYCDSLSYSGSVSYIITDKDGHCPGTCIPFDRFCRGDHAWIRVSMMIYPMDSLYIVDPVPCVSMENSRRQTYKWKGISVMNEYRDLPLFEWSKVEFDYLTPDVRTKKDNFCVSLWKAGAGKIAVDEIKVRAYTRIE